MTESLTLLDWAGQVLAPYDQAPARHHRLLLERLQAVADGEPMKYSTLNRSLHARVREIAAQPVAADLLERLQGQLVRHQFRLALRPGRPAQSLVEHLAIITAIAERDPAKAEAATRAHLRGVIDALQES